MSLKPHTQTCLKKATKIVSAGACPLFSRERVRATDCVVAVKSISSALLKNGDSMAIKYLSCVCRVSVSVCANLSHSELQLSPRFPIYNLSVGDSNLPSLCCSVTEACHRSADEGNMLSVLDGCFWKFEERQMVGEGRGTYTVLALCLPHLTCFICILFHQRPALLSALYFISQRYSEFHTRQTHIFYIVIAGDAVEETAATEKIAQVYFYRSMRCSAL